MRESKKLSLETYPLFIPAKNLKNVIAKGIFCKRSGEDKIIKLVNIERDNYTLLDEDGKEFNTTGNIFKLNFEILFFVGAPSFPDPEALFLIGDEWVLAGVTDLMGEQIKDCHIVVVNPKNIGWKRVEEKISLMNSKDIRNILEEEKVYVETEEVTIDGWGIKNMSFVTELPKIKEDKVLFILN